MLTRVPTKCPSPHFIKASILQQPSQCCCDALSQGFLWTLRSIGPWWWVCFLAKACWHSAKLLVAAQASWVVPMIHHLCQGCSNASVQTCLPGQICATPFGKRCFSNLALAAASWWQGKRRHQHQWQPGCLPQHNQELQRSPALTLWESYSHRLSPDRGFFFSFFRFVFHVFPVSYHSPIMWNCHFHFFSFQSCESVIIIFYRVSLMCS